MSDPDPLDRIARECVDEMYEGVDDSWHEEDWPKFAAPIIRRALDRAVEVCAEVARRDANENAAMAGKGMGIVYATAAGAANRISRKIRALALRDEEDEA